MELRDLQALVAHATLSPLSAFYRNLYRNLYRIRSEEAPLLLSSMTEWERLPFITKDILLATPIFERLFMPLERIDAIQSSSGTSGKLPLLSARSYSRGVRTHLHHYDFSTPFLTVSLTARFEMLLESLDRPPVVIALDPLNIPASVAISKTAKVRSVFMYTFIARQVAAQMVKEGIGEQIECVMLMGEITSRSLVEHLHTHLPNAKIVSSYSLIEMDGPIGFACKALTETLLETHHSAEGFYFEIIDPESGEVAAPLPGTEGELVVSGYPGEPYAFPIIRYRTGDMVRVEEAHCKEHGQWSFSILGRRELDFLRIPGGMLSVDEVSRTLRQCGLSDEFELRYREPETEKDQRIAIELVVEASKNTDMQELAMRLSLLLRVGPTLTFTQGVERGLYHPLSCILSTDEKGSAKKKKIIKG